MRTEPAYNLMRSDLYISCEHFNFDWTINAVCAFDNLWKEGKNVQEISRIFKRDEIEVFLLYLDRVYSGKIKPDMRRVFQ